MCTVTLYRDATSVLVTMNRDELHARAPERPPTVFEEAGSRGQWMAPIDGEAGGTWMGVNACGVVACLLNAYLPGDTVSRPRAPSRLSRGTIVPAILAQGDGSCVQAWMRGKFDPSPYEPFYLLVAWLGGGMKWRWAETTYAAHPLGKDGWTLVSSSLLEPDETLAWRREAFEQWRRAGCEKRGCVPTYHLLQVEGKEDWSPLMDRQLGGTRSITQVHVDGASRRSVLRYWPREKSSGVPVAPAAELCLPVLEYAPGPA
ncbi:MAG TPA: hypothetical protein HPP77_04880 [Candidatus Hydrogenedentes bacterium]|nr:hypothetical protein [Candidatus Hydrogenedentota bacterium]